MYIFLFHVQLHAFVEYATVEDAEKAVCSELLSQICFPFHVQHFELLWLKALFFLLGIQVTELNDERNWRSGLRVCILSNCMVLYIILTAFPLFNTFIAFIFVVHYQGISCSLQLQNMARQGLAIFRTSTYFN